MSLPTVEFAAFFVAVLLCSWLLMPHPRVWKPFMVAASLLLLAAADWRWAGLMIVSILANHAGATVLVRIGDQQRRRAVLITVIAIDVGMLGVFKYLGFFIDSVNEALAAINFGVPLLLLQVALPLGISFAALQAIGYQVDVYRRDVPVAAGWDYAVFASFFPHAVAGPILRAGEFIPQLARPRNPRDVAVVPALFLIAGGLAKKIIIADLLATKLVDPAFANPLAHSALDTGLAIVGYAIQIYCDFSAYTDIAIGTALLLGLRLPPNFDRPYSAASLRQFWRRWHMTLTRWFRDYVYIPLGGDRVDQRRTYLNLAITVMLAGLWHGAAATFLVWSALHATGLTAERALGRRRRELIEAGRESGARGEPSVRSFDSGRALIDLRTSVPIADPPSGGRTRVALRLAVAQHKVAIARQQLAGARDLWSRILDEVAARTWPRWSRHLTTFAFVSLAWVFFRANSIPDALDVIGRLVTGWSQPTTLATPVALGALAIGAVAAFGREGRSGRLQARFSRLPLVVQGVVAGGCLVVLAAVAGPQGSLPFIFGNL